LTRSVRARSNRTFRATKDRVVRPILLLLLALAMGGCAVAPPERTFFVFFAERSAALDAPADTVVADAARMAGRFPALPVTVGGYSGAAGAPEAELQLAGRRAMAVERRLIAAGVAASRIRREVHTPISYPASPVESRRVDITIGRP
jgi:outer membrane protein OmpA-like peptidoglycan-associated protein